MNSKTAHWIFAAVIIVADLHAPGTERSAQAQAPATPTVSSPPPLPPPTSSPLPTPLAKPVVPKPVVIPYDQQHYQVSISFGVDPDAGVSDRDARRMEYQIYLRTPEWAAIRERVKQRDRVCQGCLAAPIEEVHHLTYEHVQNEFAFELIGLCRKCHARLHGVAA